MFVQIKSSYFTAGLEIFDGEVMIVAPIIKYMKGWNTQRVKDYCSKKKWEYSCDEHGPNCWCSDCDPRC